MKEKKTYFVANNEWIIAGHDLSLEQAKNVLERELDKDKNNEQEREIIENEYVN